MTLPIDRVDLESLDIADLQQQKLKELFPEVFTEGGKIDFDKLKLTLGQAIDTGKERFGMNWAGKADCYKTIQQPSVATLAPARDESIDFDTTENLFIEGDNLEVLKLLQKSYFGKVKMIYIDPPYNTGNDFIYPDNYSENLDTYLEYTGQIDGEGRKFSTNPDTDGRFHSKWMNMMYPRLFLAKNLLREDGVIFISIGEEENHHLRVMCDEIFGKENFVTDFVWEKKKKPSFLHKNVGKINDFILCYVKNVDVSYPFSIESTTEGKRYPLNNAGNSESVLIFPPKSVKFNMEDGVIKPQDMSEGNILTELLDEITICNSQNENQFRLRGEWRYSQKKLDEIISLEDEILISKIPFRPNHVKSGGEIKKMKNTFSPNHYKMETNEDATQQIIDLLNGSFFDTPKPLKLISTLINSVTYENSSGIILDFFAGSATTAHAVMDLNKEDGGNRKFICVQLPEPCDEKSEAYKADYKTIAEISIERIRRASAKIQAEQNEAKGKADLFDEGTANNLLDLGFRVFKLQKSNFKVWDASTQKDAEAIQQALELHVDHIDPQAEQEAILFELLLKSGFELTTPIENLTLAGKTVFSIAEGALLICLDKALTSEVIKAMAELNPSRVICLDEGFQDNDQLKTNAVLIMKSKGVNDFRTV